FHGETRLDSEHFYRAHEAPRIMWVPLLVLVLGAIFSGWLGYDYFIGDKRMAFWSGSLVTSEHDILHLAHSIPFWAIMLPTLAGVVGIATGIYFYGKRTDIPAKLAATFPMLYQLSLNK